MFEPGKLADLISRKASPDPFTLESLIAWLEAKNPAEEYDFVSPHSCLIHQYLNCSGVQCRSVSAAYWKNSEDKYCPLPNYFAEVSSGHSRDDDLWRVWTFGAALSRARAYQAVQS